MVEIFRGTQAQLADELERLGFEEDNIYQCAGLRQAAELVRNAKITEEPKP